MGRELLEWRGRFGGRMDGEGSIEDWERVFSGCCLLLGLRSWCMRTPGTTYLCGQVESWTVCVMDSVYILHRLVYYDIWSWVDGYGGLSSDPEFDRHIKKE